MELERKYRNDRAPQISLGVLGYHRLSSAWLIHCSCLKFLLVFYDTGAKLSLLLSSGSARTPEPLDLSILWAI